MANKLVNGMVEESRSTSKIVTSRISNSSWSSSSTQETRKRSNHCWIKKESHPNLFWRTPSNVPRLLCTATSWSKSTLSFVRICTGSRYQSRWRTPWSLALMLSMLARMQFWVLLHPTPRAAHSITHRWLSKTCSDTSLERVSQKTNKRKRSVLTEQLLSSISWRKLLRSTILSTAFCRPKLLFTETVLVVLATKSTSLSTRSPESKLFSRACRPTTTLNFSTAS